MLRRLEISPNVDMASLLIIERWIALSNTRAKLNCNGASKENLGHFGVGGILRDSKEEFLFAYAKYYGSHTSLWAEAKAILNGLTIAKRKYYTHMWIELDSLVLVSMLHDLCSVP